MNWRIAEAKQKFSELINAATKEPQLIYNQDRLVAAVVEGEIFQEFLAWREKTSLIEAFNKLRQLTAEENYALEVPGHQDRPKPFADTLNDLSV